MTIDIVAIEARVSNAINEVIFNRGKFPRTAQGKADLIKTINECVMEIVSPLLAVPEFKFNIEMEGNHVTITAEEVSMILAYRKRGKDRRQVQMPFLMQADKRKYRGDRRKEGK